MIAHKVIAIFSDVILHRDLDNDACSSNDGTFSGSRAFATKMTEMHAVKIEKYLSRV